MVSHRIMPVGAYEANCIILWEGTAALVVDPGQDAEDILAFLSAHSLELKAVPRSSILENETLRFAPNV